MPGIIGGAIGEDDLSSMLERMRHEEWYEEERFSAGRFSLGFVHHGDRDPNGHTSWNDGVRFGVVDGAISNRDELSMTDAEIFEGVLERPAEMLPALEGSFTIAAVDASSDRVVLAQDKIGARQCYYAADDGLVFGSKMRALLDRLDEPHIDRQAISDMLLMGFMWGDRTLLRGVSSLRPGSFLEYDDGEVTCDRYWKPSYGMADPGEPYLRELKDRFQRSIELVGSTLDEEAGLWLSGGLDSRLTAAELKRTADETGTFDLTAYTYDGNPPEKNLDPARAVANELDLTHELVEFGAETFDSVFETVVDATDGMLRWNTAKNLATVFNVRNPPGVIMEGLAGELIGQHLCRHHLTDCSSAVESMYQSEAVNDVDTVRSLLSTDVDPLDSFRAEAEFSDETSRTGKILDAHFQNYYARMAHVSNQVPRIRVGTRVTYADGQFLDQAAKLPLKYRMGTVPFTGQKIPYGITESKFWLMREIDQSLAEIPYERSSLPPKYPFPMQVAGFVTSTAIARLQSQVTYGGHGLVDEWYRQNDAFRERIDDLLEAACDRPFFDEDRLREIHREQSSGEGHHMQVIAPVTTLECWFQRHLDPQRRKVRAV